MAMVYGLQVDILVNSEPQQMLQLGLLKTQTLELHIFTQYPTAMANGLQLDRVDNLEPQQITFL